MAVMEKVRSYGPDLGRQGKEMNSIVGQCGPLERYAILSVWLGMPFCSETAKATVTLKSMKGGTSIID